MAVLSPETFWSEAERGNFRSFYFLTGEEYQREKALSLLLSKTVSPEARDLNVDIFYGDNLDPKKVVNALLSFPMMSDRKLVVIKRPSLASESLLNPIFSVLQTPVPYSVLVIIDEPPGLQKLRRRYPKAISSFCVVDFKKLYGKDLIQWVVDRFGAEGKSIDREAAQLLVALAGDDLSDIANEIANVALFVGDKRKVEKGDVEEAVGASRSNNVFELSRAIGERRFDEAKVIMRRMMNLGEKLPRIVYILSDYFSNLLKVKLMMGKGLSRKAMAEEVDAPSWLLDRYISHAENLSREGILESLKALMDADNRLKSSGYDPLTTMELLIHKICSANK